MLVPLMLFCFLCSPVFGQDYDEDFHDRNRGSRFQNRWWTEYSNLDEYDDDQIDRRLNLIITRNILPGDLPLPVDERLFFPRQSSFEEEEEFVPPPQPRRHRPSTTTPQPPPPQPSSTPRPRPVPTSTRRPFFRPTQVSRPPPQPLQPEVSVEEEASPEFNDDDLLQQGRSLPDPLQPSVLSDSRNVFVTRKDAPASFNRISNNGPRRGVRPASSSTTLSPPPTFSSTPQSRRRTTTRTTTSTLPPPPPTDSFEEEEDDESPAPPQSTPQSAPEFFPSSTPIIPTTFRPQGPSLGPISPVTRQPLISEPPLFASSTPVPPSSSQQPPRRLQVLKRRMKPHNSTNGEIRQNGQRNEISGSSRQPLESSTVPPSGFSNAGAFSPRPPPRGSTFFPSSASTSPPRSDFSNLQRDPFPATQPSVRLSSPQRSSFTPTEPSRGSFSSPPPPVSPSRVPFEANVFSSSPRPLQNQGFSSSQQPLQNQGFSSSPRPLQNQGFSSSPRPLQNQGFSSSPRPLQNQGFPSSPRPLQNQGFSSSPRPLQNQGFSSTPRPSQGHSSTIGTTVFTGSHRFGGTPIPVRSTPADRISSQHFGSNDIGSSPTLPQQRRRTQSPSSSTPVPDVRRTQAPAASTPVPDVRRNRIPSSTVKPRQRVTTVASTEPNLPATEAEASYEDEDEFSSNTEIIPPSALRESFRQVPINRQAKITSTTAERTSTRFQRDDSRRRNALLAASSSPAGVAALPDGTSIQFSPDMDDLYLFANLNTLNDNQLTKASRHPPVNSTPTYPYQNRTGSVPSFCFFSDRTYCPLTEAYPTNLVQRVISEHGAALRELYHEAGSKQEFPDVTSNDASAEINGQFVCEAQAEIVHPGWALDSSTREWMVVINTKEFPQTVRIESCVRQNDACLFISPYYRSSCRQRYSLQRLVAIHPHFPDRGPQMTLFKMPCGCSCMVGMGQSAQQPLVSQNRR